MSTGVWKVRGMKKKARLKLNKYVRLSGSKTCDVLERLIDSLPELEVTEKQGGK